MPSHRPVGAPSRRDLWRYIGNAASKKVKRPVRARQFSFPGKAMESYRNKAGKRVFIPYVRALNVVPRTADRYLTANRWNYPAKYKIDKIMRGRKIIRHRKPKNTMTVSSILNPY